MSEHTHHHDHEPSASECADFLERIVYFLDNELDEADCAVVRMHLDTCNPCLEKYDLQRTVALATGLAHGDLLGIVVGPCTGQRPVSQMP